MLLSNQLIQSLCIFNCLNSMIASKCVTMAIESVKWTLLSPKAINQQNSMWGERVRELKEMEEEKRSEVTKVSSFIVAFIQLVNIIYDTLLLTLIPFRREETLSFSLSLSLSFNVIITLLSLEITQTHHYIISACLLRHIRIC